MKHSFENVYIEYLSYIEYRQKEQSKKTIEERFNNIIIPFFKGIYIEDIKKLEYIKFQEYLVSKNYSMNYIKNNCYYLKSFLRYCSDSNIVVDLSIFDVKIPKGKVILKNKKVYTLSEFRQFINCLDHKVISCFFRFLYFTGCRPGEAMALKFSDLSYCSISINKDISEHCVNGKRVISTPKTYSSIRDISLDYKTYKMLLDLKKYYKASDDYFIFGGKKPLSPTTINRYKLEACKKCGLDPITLHQFRHSHATMLLDKKLSIKVISERLGHSNSSTTMNIYLHSTKKQEKRVLRTLNFLNYFL